MLIDTLLQNAEAGKPGLAVLIDPDKALDRDLPALVRLAEQSGVDYFFVGGSLLTQTRFEEVMQALKSLTNKPVIIFPGSSLQISSDADAILLLSLVSGRNPDLLIGQHVVAAPYLKQAGIEIWPTGYMLVDGGRATTASYVSNTQPIPADKPEIAMVTAMAAEMLGMRIIYCDAGSGAQQPVPPAVIEAVSNAVQCPVIVGGGIRSYEAASDALDAGADVIVVGNILEQSPETLFELSEAVHARSTK